MLYNMEVGGTPQEQFANNLELQAEIKNAIIIKLMSNNPKLAKAIAYRSIYSRLYASGDLASFYDQNGSYKKEVQTYLAPIKVELNNLLGTGQLKKYLYAICLYNFLVFQPQDLFDEEPILCYYTD